MLPETSERRIRFSLLNLLLILTVAGLAFGLYAARKRHNLLQYEIQALKVETYYFKRKLGLFPVDDPSQVYAQLLESGDNLIGKFRVHLPKERQYYLVAQVGRALADLEPLLFLGELPNSTNMVQLDERKDERKIAIYLFSGINEIKLHYNRDFRGQLSCEFQTQSEDPSVSLGGPNIRIPEKEPGSGRQLMRRHARNLWSTGDTYKLDPTRPVLLYSGKYDDDQGLAIWIEPVLE